MPYDVEQRRLLLSAAEHAIRSAVNGEAAVDPAPLRAAGLDDPRGAFVTVRVDGGLRGCRGHLETDAPLYETVIRLAPLAAVDDPRFPPVTIKELAGLGVEVSVLLDRRRVEAPDTIVLGRDGLLLTADGRRGFLLPQVAVEHGFDLETFLDRLCLKAGVPEGSWRRPDARLEAFEVVHF